MYIRKQRSDFCAKQRFFKGFPAPADLCFRASLHGASRAGELYYYFKHLLSELPERADENGNIDPSTLDDLMQWAEGLPEECYKRR